MNRNRRTIRQRATAGISTVLAGVAPFGVLLFHCAVANAYPTSGYDPGEPIQFEFISPYPSPTPPATSGMATCENAYEIKANVHDPDNFHDGLSDFVEWDEIDWVRLEEKIGSEWVVIDYAGLTRSDVPSGDPEHPKKQYLAIIVLDGAEKPSLGQHKYRLHAKDKNVLPAKGGGNGDDPETPENKEVSVEWTLEVFEISLEVDSGLPGESADHHLLLNAMAGHYDEASVHAVLDPPPYADIPICLTLGALPQGAATLDRTELTKGAPLAYLRGHAKGQYWLGATRCGAWKTCDLVEGTIFELQAYLDLQQARPDARPKTEPRPSVVDLVDEPSDGQKYWITTDPPWGGGYRAVGGATVEYSELENGNLQRVSCDMRAKTPDETYELEGETYTEWAGGPIVQALIRTRTDPRGISFPARVKVTGKLTWKSVDFYARAHSNRAEKPGAGIAIQFLVFSFFHPFPSGSGIAGCKAFIELGGIQDSPIEAIAKADWAPDGIVTNDPAPQPLSCSLSGPLNLGELGGAGVEAILRATASAARMTPYPGLGGLDQAQAWVLSGDIVLEEMKYWIEELE
jgi:hypothetical protein